MTCLQKRTGSVSLESSVTHANAVAGADARAVPNHSVSSVDLPNPAGAQIRVRLAPLPWPRISTRAGRRMAPRGIRWGGELGREKRWGD